MREIHHNSPINPSAPTRTPIPWLSQVRLQNFSAPGRHEPVGRLLSVWTAAVTTAARGMAAGEAAAVPAEERAARRTAAADLARNLLLHAQSLAAAADPCQRPDSAAAAAAAGADTDMVPADGCTAGGRHTAALRYLASPASLLADSVEGALGLLAISAEAASGDDVAHVAPHTSSGFGEILLGAATALLGAATVSGQRDIAFEVHGEWRSRLTITPVQGKEWHTPVLATRWYAPAACA